MESSFDAERVVSSSAAIPSVVADTVAAAVAWASLEANPAVEEVSDTSCYEQVLASRNVGGDTLVGVDNTSSR